MIMLFAGSSFYPSGGWDDFRGYFNTIEEAKAFLLDNWESFDICCSPWAHIVKEDQIVLKATLDNLLSSSSQEWAFEEVHVKFDASAVTVLKE